eukprot:1920075-Rhodomonas_salina.2
MFPTQIGTQRPGGFYEADGADFGRFASGVSVAMRVHLEAATFSLEHKGEQRHDAQVQHEERFDASVSVQG